MLSQAELDAHLQAILSVIYRERVPGGANLAGLRDVFAQAALAAKLAEEREMLLGAMRDSLSIECRKPCLNALAKVKEREDADKG